jgi:hypothetical protein
MAECYVPEIASADFVGLAMTLLKTVLVIYISCFDIVPASPRMLDEIGI